LSGYLRLQIQCIFLSFRICNFSVNKQPLHPQRYSEVLNNKNIGNVIIQYLLLAEKFAVLLVTLAILHLKLTKQKLILKTKRKLNMLIKNKGTGIKMRQKIKGFNLWGEAVAFFVIVSTLGLNTLKFELDLLLAMIGPFAGVLSVFASVLEVSTLAMAARFVVRDLNVKIRVNL
jgi:hypothetical protein